MGDLADLLSPYRSQESRDDLAVVVDDPESIRVLAAWRRTRVEWRAPKRKRPECADGLWWWLWDGVSYDLEALAVAGRLSEQRAATVLRALVVARLSYPDGSISAHAEELVTAHVERRHPSKATGRPPGVRDGKRRAAKGTGPRAKAKATTTKRKRKA